MTWTLAKAKNHLSEVIRRAVDQGPQTISVGGRYTAVLVAKDEFDRMKAAGGRRDFKAFLLAIPSLEGVELERDTSAAN